MKSVYTKKTKLQIPLPQGWHDVKFIDGLRIVGKEMSEIETLSIVSGVDKKKLEKETDLETIQYLINSLLFLRTLPIKKHPEFPRSVRGVKLPYVNYSDKFENLTNFVIDEKDKRGFVIAGNKIYAIILSH